MIKKIALVFLLINLTACGELGQVLEQVATTATSQSLSQQQIGQGLKEALTNGITKRVTGLAATDGFYKDQVAKIMYPAELQKVDKTLRSIGLGSLADEGMKMLNRAAEDAVGEAIPIFKQAITGMSFNDARKILMGDKDAATQYLKSTTSTALQAKFKPIIQNSFKKVGADRVWNQIMTKYNKIPLVKPVNTDLTAYTTDQALVSVFKKVAVEEQKIRTDVNSRTSSLLKSVFALQD